MVPETLTTSVEHTGIKSDASRFAKVANTLRNMTEWKPNKDKKVAQQDRMKNGSSPYKQSASHRHQGQPHTRNEIDEAMTRKLAGAQQLFHDLGDHVLGHIVSTELAKDILHRFVQNGFVRVFEGMNCQGDYDLTGLLMPDSTDVRTAIQLAFEDADLRGCMKQGEGKGPQKDAESKGKQKAKTYSFKWTWFPKEPLREKELVNFLNEITCRAYEIAKSKLPVTGAVLRHRFATLVNPNQAMPLSYEPDGEDMRPDFLLLPLEAFQDDSKLDPMYVNFTTSRLVGESKNKDLSAGVEQMQRYARGLKRAQPWVYYVLGMTITKDRVVFLRGEASGTERLELSLADGRGCIEFVRILLGLALADKNDLGHNPHVELAGREQICIARNVAYRSDTSKATALWRAKKDQPYSMPDPLSHPGNSAVVAARIDSSRLHSAVPPLFQQEPKIIASSSGSVKRTRSQITEHRDEGMRPKKRKTNDSSDKEVELTGRKLTVPRGR